MLSNQTTICNALETIKQAEGVAKLIFIAFMFMPVSLRRPSSA
jgi:hypothetical protein